MYLSLVSGLLLVIMCDQILPTVTYVDVESLDIENFARQRGKRSLIIPASKVVKKIGQGYKLLRGYFARQTLLKGAGSLGISKGANIYEKPGGLAQMVKDFDSVNPSDIRIYVEPGGVIVKVGQVGNRQIKLRSRIGLRELHLSNPEKTGNGLDDVINYTDK